MSYVPPHKRNQVTDDAPKSEVKPTTANGSTAPREPREPREPRKEPRPPVQSSRWVEGPQDEPPRNGYDRGFGRDGYDRGFDRGYGRDGYDRGHGRDGYDRGFDRGYGRERGFNNRFGGRWNDSKKNERLEEELFGNAITTGINFDKYEDIPVEITGKDTPKPVDSFDESQLHDLLMKNIERAKYTKPTPVQKYSIPIGLSRRDLMACAQTGSGKTGGFLFPIINNLLAAGIGTTPERRGYTPGYHPGRNLISPQALILSPTRELTTQIYDEARKFCYETELRPVVLYGGTSVSEQIRDLQRGCNILVATPGRLVDLIQRGYVSLSKVQFFVLDEADNMLDMGFEPQIRQIVEGEDLPPKNERQTMMFSATFPSEIQKLATSFLKDYLFLTVGRVGSTTDLITQIVEYVEDRDKIDALHYAIEKSKDGLTLVFTKTKRDCDAVDYELSKIGMRCESIHGDRTQQERERALQRFKNGEANVLIATDVASRGLNIPNVTHVINFDLPENIDSYIHRIGRTGRAGNEGRATSFYNQNNSMIIVDLISILEETQQAVPDWMKQERALYERSRQMKKKSKMGGGKYGSSSNLRSKPISRWSGGSSYGGGFGDSGGFGAPKTSWG